MAAGIVRDVNTAAHYVVGNKSNQGPQGDIGTQDIQGEAGTQFLTSNRDSVGVVAGLKGRPASIKIGSVLIGEDVTGVVIENVGNLSDVVSNFITLRGDRGETGKDDISDVNEGNADLNVKRITSDEDNIKSDGFGNLSLFGVKLKDISGLTSFENLPKETIYFDSKKNNL